MGTALAPEPWTTTMGGDPRGWLLECAEPAARWIALTGLLDRPADDPDVADAHAAVVADPSTRALLDRLPDWGADNHLSGHASPAFAPNLLGLLADLGVTADDDERIGRVLDAFLAHQEATGRFATFGTSRASSAPVWGALLCDTHAITEVLVRFGREQHPAVQRALDAMTDDLAATPQGEAWPCVPHPVSGFRGPGRRADFCPQVTLEALRTWARLPQVPDRAGDAARTALRAWRVRGEEKPYMFGHGAAFKTVKWPALWYSVLEVLDTLGRYPGLWRGASADPADRRALAELAACLVAYNVGPDGTVTPRSCYRGFEAFSFGRKTAPSGIATACVAVVLRRLGDLAEDVAAVDVTRLTSSKGGTGTPVPPRG